jgi:hypothetical protein
VRCRPAATVLRAEQRLRSHRAPATNDLAAFFRGSRSGIEAVRPHTPVTSCGLHQIQIEPIPSGCSPRQQTVWCACCWWRYVAPVPLLVARYVVFTRKPWTYGTLPTLSSHYSHQCCDASTLPHQIFRSGWTGSFFWRGSCWTHMHARRSCPTARGLLI